MGKVMVCTRNVPAGFTVHGKTPKKICFSRVHISAMASQLGMKFKKGGLKDQYLRTAATKGSAEMKIGVSSTAKKAAARWLATGKAAYLAKKGVSGFGEIEMLSSDVGIITKLGKNKKGRSGLIVALSDKPKGAGARTYYYEDAYRLRTSKQKAADRAGGERIKGKGKKFKKDHAMVGR